jgi:hypothetical protein
MLIILLLSSTSILAMRAEKSSTEGLFGLHIAAFNEIITSVLRVA